MTRPVRARCLLGLFERHFRLGLHRVRLTPTQPRFTIGFLPQDIAHGGIDRSTLPHGGRLFHCLGVRGRCLACGVCGRIGLFRDVLGWPGRLGLRLRRGLDGGSTAGLEPGRRAIGALHIPTLGRDQAVIHLVSGAAIRAGQPHETQVLRRGFGASARALQPALLITCSNAPQSFQASLFPWIFRVAASPRRLATQPPIATEAHPLQDNTKNWCEG